MSSHSSTHPSIHLFRHTHKHLTDENALLSTVLFKFYLIFKVKVKECPGTDTIRINILPLNKKGKLLTVQIDKSHQEHTLNRVNSFFPKGGTYPPIPK